MVLKNSLQHYEFKPQVIYILPADPMLKAYKYRIYPTSEQELLINRTIGICRLVYNLALETKIRAWQSAGINLSAYDLIYQLVELKDAYPWMKNIDSQALTAAVKNVDVAFKHFFRGAGYPKFKSKKTGTQSFHCPCNKRKVDLEKSTLTVPKIHDIPIVLSRKFTGKIKTVTISRTPAGRYFASILVDTGEQVPEKPAIRPETAIGIDVGIKSFVATSDGRRFEPNRKLQDNLARLQCLSKRLARKQKGGRNRNKVRLQVARLHETIANQRNDYIHQVTTRLIRDNQTETIVIEDLNVSGMLKNRKLARAVMDVSWGRFFEVLKYKCNWYGRNLVVIDRFDPSSKRCSCCGEINAGLTLADRHWQCRSCDTSHDRDANAAVNILWYGMQQQKADQINTPEGIREEPVESRRLRRAKKQECIQIEDLVPTRI